MCRPQDTSSNKDNKTRTNENNNLSSSPTPSLIESSSSILSTSSSPSFLLRPMTWISILTIFVACYLFVGSQTCSCATSSSSSSFFSLEKNKLSNNVDNSKSKLERGKLIETINAAALYKAYKEMQLDYENKMKVSSQWKVLKQRNQVSVSMLVHPEDPNCPYVKMVGIMPVPPQECWDWLQLSQWHVNMPKMDPFYEGVDMHGEFQHRGVHMILARKRTKRILAFGKRDFTFISVADLPQKNKNGATLTSGTVSVIAPNLLPRQRHYTRGFQDSIAFYKPYGPNGEQTELSIICRLDLNDSSEGGDGGAVPMWLYVKTVGVTALQSVLNMQHQLQLDKEARQQQEPQEQEQQQQRRRFSIPFFGRKQNN